ncbi:hypothetical protein GPL15_05480 [Clostridium sp. MCC353]|uniref:ATP-grasp domain-containing protein n=1 Tax=Clostridium sp. MCC353 TaxID=2592646 RepID=UPI001C0158AE|nr:ATP-grasp domain-containing protein [Clostridium sp. MCC353]MBT9775953.1 hypothetical protein [Clostridium sp. MCC353]
MIRVWFNHWFSTSYRLIELMKEDEKEEVYVIGSNRKVNAVIQKVCDEWYEEPCLDGEDYINYCVDFCREHQVQVFVPRRKMVDISRHMDRFLRMGVRVLVDDYEKIALLNDKAAAYQMFKECKGIHVPDYALVRDVDSLETAYASLKERHNDLCIKFVEDEGGMSFRRLKDHVDEYQSLCTYPGNGIAYEDLIRILKPRGTFKDMMIMPYLPGDEISVDCLNTKSGLIAVPRVKGASRDERVVFDEEIHNMCEIILKKVPLQYPCNIQFKLKGQIPYLLEINTRMSGGLQMSCLSAGVNIPNIALNKVLGREISWDVCREEHIVSYIEMPVIIK